MGGPVEVSTERITIKPRLVVPRSFKVFNLAADKWWNLVFDIEAELIPEVYSYGLKSIQVRARYPNEFVKPSDLRTLSVAELLTEANWLAVPSELLQQRQRLAKSEYLSAKAGDRMELLELAAQRAAVARLTSRDPNKELVECFDITQRTATRWLAEAREKGLLD